MPNEEILKDLVDSIFSQVSILLKLSLESACTIGFNEGRPKWHDLRKDPNDLPKKDEKFVTEVSETVLSQKGQRVIYYFEEKKWYSDWQEEKVFAWLELPKFKDA